MTTIAITAATTPAMTRRKFMTTMTMMITKQKHSSSISLSLSMMMMTRTTRSFVSSSSSLSFYFHRLSSLSSSSTSLLSTSTAAAVTSSSSSSSDDDEEDEEVRTTTPLKSTATMRNIITIDHYNKQHPPPTTTTIINHHHRNRYHQLRERLRQEEMENNKSTSLSYYANQTLSSPPPQVQRRRHQPSPASSSTPLPMNRTMDGRPDQHNSNDENEQENETTRRRRKVHNLFQRLQQLPDPPPISSAILTDRHQRHHTYLRISLIEKCNLRCTYCMPEQGLTNLHTKEELLTTKEIITLAQYFIQRGVTKFRLTGGEPTLRRDIVDVVTGLAQLQQYYHIKPNIGITTNGITLYQHIDALIAAGLTSINISLDTLDPSKFSTITRRPPSYYHKVLQSIEAAIQHRDSLKSPIKLNVVLMRTVNDNEIYHFLQFLQQRCNNSNNSTQSRNDVLQIRFIEYMPFQDNGWDTNYFISYREAMEYVHTQHPHVRFIPSISDDIHDTTKWYHVAMNENDHDDVLDPDIVATLPKIGFITSMSHHFCGTCNRLRLTADGDLKVCLFDGSHDHSHDDNNIISLRDVIRYAATDHNHDTDIDGNNNNVMIHDPSINDRDENTNTVATSRNGQNSNMYRNLDKVIYYAIQKKHYALGGHDNPQHIQELSYKNRPMTMIGG